MKFVFVAVLALLVVLASAQKDCVPVIQYPSIKKAYRYNLKSIYHQDGMPDTLTYDDGSSAYFINPCGHTTFDCDNADASVCLRTPLYTTAVLGVLESQQWMAANDSSIAPGKGLMVIYGDGDECPAPGTGDRAILYLVCDESGTGGDLEFLGKTDDCAYSFRYRTTAACGTEVSYGNSGDTVALALLLILIFGFILYFVVGWILNKFVFHKEGSFFELLPQYLFWSSLPGLLKDGCLFIAHGFKKGDYVSV